MGKLKFFYCLIKLRVEVVKTGISVRSQQRSASTPKLWEILDVEQRALELKTKKEQFLTAFKKKRNITSCHSSTLPTSSPSFQRLTSLTQILKLQLEVQCHLS